MSSYCFPVLEIKDCVAYMKDIIDAEINEVDFKQPVRHRWQKYYTEMLCRCCMDLTPEVLTQMPMVSDLSHQELFEDCIPLLTLLKCMQAFLSTCGVPDFKLSDILTPKTKRLLKMCSGFINYLRFQEEREQVFQDLKNENDALQDHRENLVQENEEMKQNINSLRARQAETEVEVEAVQVEIDDWNDKLSVKQQEATTLQMASTEAKTTNSERKANLARVKEQVIAIKEENTKLNAKIVPSPDRMQGEKERMERQLTRDKHSKENLNKLLGDCRKRSQLQEQRDQETDLATRCIDTVSLEMDKHKTLLSKVNELQEDLGNKRADMRQLDTKIQQLMRQVAIKQEKIEKLAMQHNMRVRDRSATVEQLQGELSSQEQHCGEQHQRMKYLSMEIQKINSTTEEEDFIYKENMNKMKGKYHDLLTEIDLYHKRLGESYEKNHCQ